MPNFLQEDYGVMQSGADTTFPASGTWQVGDRIFNQSPTLANPYVWICTTAGSTGGTWTPISLQPVSTVTANSAAASVPVSANVVSITGSGGYNLTLAAPSAANNGTHLYFVNASSGTVTFVAATGTVLVGGSATAATNTQAHYGSVGTSWYRI